MKVLLKIANLFIQNRMWIQRINQSLLIWVGTNLLGSFLLWLSNSIGLKLGEIMLVSLIFSAPTVLFLIPNLYLLVSISERSKRIAFAIVSILILCSLVIVFFLWFVKDYPVGNSRLITILLPYVFSAEMIFLLIARKQIQHGLSYPKLSFKK